MVGEILETDGRRAYIRSTDDNDYISSSEHFKFGDSGHTCLIEGMSVEFDVGQSAKGRIRAENIRIVDWPYISNHQAELVAINFSSGIGTASTACGCHVRIHADRFLTDAQYVNSEVVKTGMHLIADLQTYSVNGMTKLKAFNIEILGWDEHIAKEPALPTPQQQTPRTLKQIIVDEREAKSKS
jgi:hypothetical protein